MIIEGDLKTIKAVINALPLSTDEHEVRNALKKSGFSVSRGCNSSGPGRDKVEVTVSKNGGKIDLAFDREVS